MIFRIYASSKSKGFCYLEKFEFANTNCYQNEELTKKINELINTYIDGLDKDEYENVLVIRHIKKLNMDEPYLLKFLNKEQIRTR